MTGSGSTAPREAGAVIRPEGAATGPGIDHGDGISSPAPGPRRRQVSRVEDVQVAFDGLPEFVFGVAPQAAVLLPPVVLPVAVAPAAGA